MMEQLGNVKEARALATEITSRGARLHDLLGKEREARPQRLKAVAFLEVSQRRAGCERVGGFVRGWAGGWVPQEYRSLGNGKRVVVAEPVSTQRTFHGTAVALQTLRRKNRLYYRKKTMRRANRIECGEQTEYNAASKQKVASKAREKQPTNTQPTTSP